MDAESSPATAMGPYRQPKSDEAGTSLLTTLSPQVGAGRWAGEWYHLGRNKEVFDAERYAILRATGVLLRLQESGEKYIVFSNSTAVIERVRTDRPGPGQVLVMAVIQFEEVMRERGCTLTIRWAPAHKGAGGNETADTYAKWVADRYTNPIGKGYLRETSLAHLSGKTTEARLQNAREWIRWHVRSERRYHPPKGGKTRKDLQREIKGVASRYFQLLSGHAAIGPYLVGVAKTIQSGGCWWCNSGER